MQYGAIAAGYANNDFIRYHHLRSCIYFAVGTIESLMNQEMHYHLTQQGEIEENIQGQLRKPIMKKIKDWPAIMYGRPVALPAEIVTVFDEFREIRNEITHPKLRDHAIYYVLDQSNISRLVDTVATALVTIYEAKSKPFPYWVLGWNYVGMNGNPAFPMELNNLNGFVHSLKAMGYSGIGHDLSYEQRCMSTVEHYRYLRDQLANYPEDIEPYWPRFPHKPRLTRRWWDHEFIIRNVIAARTSNPTA